MNPVESVFSPSSVATPVAVTTTLVAVTKEAKGALGGRREVHITQFPFNVGRESRVAPPANRTPVELRLGVAPQLNDLYLVERAGAHSLHISSGHFAIEYADDRFFLVDRGSACGTIVAGTRIGGHHKGGRTELRDGDQVIVGTYKSPYAFRFEIVPE